MKYCTSSRDGTVKIWSAVDLKHLKEIKVTNGYWVTCITYMTKSEYLVAASANRMISFYDMKATNNDKPCSRIEDLVGIPLCMEYYRWPSHNIKDGKLETLLVGDDLGICHMYNFKKDFHTCTSRLADVILKRDTMQCHFKEIHGEFETAINQEWEAQHSK